MSRSTTKPTNYVCSQQWLRSAWASAQSDHSLRFALFESLRTECFLYADIEDSDQTGRMPGWSESSLGACVILKVLSCCGSNTQWQKSSLGEPRHDKTNKITVRPAMTRWASTQSDQSSPCAQWVAKDPRFLHADSKGSDQTGQMPSAQAYLSLRWAHTLLVLSCRGSSENGLKKGSTLKWRILHEWSFHMNLLNEISLWRVS